MRKLVLLPLVIAVLLLAGCAAPTPQTVIQVVTQEVTRLVERTVEVTVAAPRTVPGGPPLLAYSAAELAGGQGVILNGLLSAAQARGWALAPANAAFNAARQGEQVEYLLSLGPQAVAAVPVDSAAICTAIEKVKAAGLPFFSIDRPPTGCAADLTVQSDHYLAGKQAGETLVELLTQRYGAPQGVLLELQGDMQQAIAIQRGQGFNDVIAQYPDIQVIQRPTAWQAANFSSAVLEVVTTQPVDGIYLHSDCVGASTVVDTLDTLDKKLPASDPGHVYIAGVDGCPETLRLIREGFIDQASSQPLPDYGLLLAEFIARLLDGQPLQEETITIEGASWSPLRIVRSEAGLLASLATTNVTSANADSPALWGNQAP